MPETKHTMKRHGQQISSKRIAAHYSKPSRAARYSRRWDARVKALGTYLAERDYGATVGRFVPVICHRKDPARAFRIAEYLFKRASRKAA